MDIASDLIQQDPQIRDSKYGIFPDFDSMWSYFESLDVVGKIKELIGPEEFEARVAEKKRIREEKIEMLEREVVKFENKVKYAVALRDDVIDINSLSISQIIEVLRNQGFVAFPEKESEDSEEGYGYLFDVCITYPEEFEILCLDRDRAKATLALEKKRALDAPEY